MLDKLKAGDIPIFLPTLTLVEVAGTFSRVTGLTADAVQYGDTIARIRWVRLIDLDESLGRQAAKIAADHRLRGADAVYAAVASVYGCTLISRDREHLTRLNGLIRGALPEAVTPTL